MHLIGEVTYNCINRTGESSEEHGVLLREHAMDIYMDGEFYASVMCTEDKLEELVLGRLISDGMIKSADEVKLLKISEDHSVADVECIEIPDVKVQKSKQIYYPDEWIFAMADAVETGAKLHEKTGASHGCFLYREGKQIFFCEDIRRHNTIDKVIGYAVKNKEDLSSCAVYTTGRVPVDMMDKIIIAGIPILVSKGMPSVQAVELAKEARITLICGARQDQMRIYTDYRI